jgi:flagellar hook-basal body complex protein FliE
MSDETHDDQVEPQIPAEPRKEVKGRGLTGLNLLLLLLSAILLALVGTSPEPVGELTKQRWEIALTKLQNLPASLMGNEDTSIDPNNPSQVSALTVARIARLAEEVHLLSEQLAEARSDVSDLQTGEDSPTLKASELSSSIGSISETMTNAQASMTRFFEGPDSTIAQAAVVSGQLAELSRELALVRTAVGELLESTEAGLGLNRTIGVPKILSEFLDEAKKPTAGEVFDRDTLDKARASLVDLINELPTTARDDLRVEIRDANWLLEARDILTDPAPESFEERIGQYASLALLVDDAPEDLPLELTSALDKRSSDLATSFAKEFDAFVSAFRGLANGPNPQINDALVERGALLANVLAEFLEEERNRDFVFLPAWIQDWQDWSDRLAKRPVQSDQSLLLVETSRILQEGRFLEEQLKSARLPIPLQLTNDLATLASSIVKIEQSAVNAYQIWALEQIDLVRKFAGEDAATNIEKSFTLGKSNRDAVYNDPVLSKLYTDKPAFRSKLQELAGLAPLSYTDGVPINLQEIATKMGTTFSWKGLPELAKALNQDLLEQHLLPIDESLLRRPIDSLYSEVFQKCWIYLEGSPERDTVAKTAATIEKKTISLQSNP